MVFLHDTIPQTGFPTAAFSRRRSAALLQMSEQIVKHFSCADLSPYVSLTFLPNVILALTEKPSSKFEVCVSHPGQRVFHHHFSTSRGWRHLYCFSINEAGNTW